MANGQKGKVINLLRGDTYEKRLERKVISLSEKRDKRFNKSSFENNTLLTELSEKINQSVSDNESLFEILPDIKLAMSILISGILSPKDLLNCELNYSLNVSLVDKEIILGINSIIEEHFTKKYNLNDILYKLLEDTLFLTGSYPLLILPETEIDKIINSDCVISKESVAVNKTFNTTLGLLSNKKRVYEHLEITDNFNVLKKPRFKDKIRNDKIEEILHNQSISTEKKGFTRYKRKYETVPLSLIEPSDEKITGEPIIIKLSSECIIPVHIPGDPSDHVGYFILLDKNGYPINGERDRKTYEQLQGRMSIGTDNDLRELIRQTKMAIFGYSPGDYKPNEFNLEIYCQLLEKELMDRLEGGVYDDKEVEISHLERVSKIMMARALHKKHSVLLFVPEKLVSYIAFDYTKEGVGKSLLEDTRILSSLRSVLIFANVLASIKNSVPRTGVKIDLDETDPNPRETVEFLLNEFTKNHNQAFPIGLTNPADIVDAIQRSSIDVAVSGNTAYPETTLDITDKARAVAKPDPDLENMLRRRHYMALGLPPEIIDADMNVEFATTIIGSNAMVAKRISIYQAQLSRKLNDFVKKYILASESLTDSIMEKIGKRKKEESRKEMFDNVLNSINITLPSPDTTKLETQLSAYETYSSGLEKTLLAYFSPELLGRLIDPDLEDALEPTLQCIKAYYERQWLQNNNVFNELTSLIDINDPESKLRMDIIQDDHIKGLIETVGKLMAKIKKTGEAMMLKVGETPEEEESEGEEPTSEEPTETPEEEGAMGEEEETPETEMELPEAETGEGVAEEETPAEVEEVPAEGETPAEGEAPPA